MEDCLMIGDSHVDVQAAKNASIPIIAFDYGIGDKQKLIESEPDLILNDFSALKSELF